MYILYILKGYDKLRTHYLFFCNPCAFRNLGGIRTQHFLIALQPLVYDILGSSKCRRGHTQQLPLDIIKRNIFSLGVPEVGEISLFWLLCQKRTGPAYCSNSMTPGKTLDT